MPFAIISSSRDVRSRTVIPPVKYSPDRMLATHRVRLQCLRAVPASVLSDRGEQHGDRRMSVLVVVGFPDTYRAAQVACELQRMDPGWADELALAVTVA